MSNERHDPDFLIGVAGEIVSQRFGDEIRLRAGKTFSTLGSIVIRCHVIDALIGIPPTFIIKKTREDQFGYHPDSPETDNSAHWILNDWAATSFLNESQCDPPLSPIFYGGSRAHGLIVLEDLGDGEAPTTDDALNGNDPVVAEQTLIEHASLIGKLHASTMGKVEEYRRRRRELGPPPTPKKLYQDPWSDARTSPIQKMVEAGARWNIFHVIHRLPEALKGNRPRGPTTLRQQVVAWIGAFADLSDEYGRMQALGKSAREMVTHLSKLWPAENCDLPYYPAFRHLG